MLGWHKDDVHHILKKNLPHLLSFAPRPPRIFVPLCGKTKDMAYLASLESVGGVVGLDGVEKALSEFAKENPDLAIDMDAGEDVGPFVKYGGKKISLIQADFFEIDATILGGRVDVVWDRASVVAIRPELREKYVEKLGSILKPGGVALFATLDRRAGTEEGRADGPPFSVDLMEMRRLFEKADWVDKLILQGEFNEFEKNPSSEMRWTKKGVTSMFELEIIVKAKGVIASEA
mmetsp:Transcript_24028/g.54645  ORF Transcript_24028/g.54645 Transcript_24028/m.54645 type:complete len:233 (-) Transcript_24028:108-806(-)